MGEFCVVKVFDATVRSLADLKRAIGLVSSLSAAGLNISSPISERGVGLEGNKSYVVFRYIKGLDLYAGTRASDGFRNHRDLAASARFQAMAHRLGCVTLSDEWTFSAEVPTYLFPRHTLVQSGWAETIASFPLLRRNDSLLPLLDKIETVVRPFAQAASASIAGATAGIVQHDLIPRNLVFNRAGDICGIIDIDFCSYTPLIWDLAWTLDYLGYPRPWIAAGHKPRLEVMNGYLIHYIEHANIPVDTKSLTALLPLARLEFCLSTTEYLLSLKKTSLAYREINWLLDYLLYYSSNCYNPIV